jgi:hypothetical protein
MNIYVFQRIGYKKVQKLLQWKCPDDSRFWRFSSCLMAYPPKGSPDCSRYKHLLSPVEVELDEHWFLDHGARCY